MYDTEQSPSLSGVIPGDGAGVRATSVEHLQPVAFEDGGSMLDDCLGADDVSSGPPLPPPDGLYGNGGAFHDGVEIPHVDSGVGYDGVLMQNSCPVSNQLTLSFRGQCYVFDSVTAEKVQAVLLLLGGCEYTPGAETPCQRQKGPMESNWRCSDPKRLESLNRFRKKRKERCFEKKIRYNVRQEAALRMQRKKGQFAPKIPEESAEGDISEGSGTPNDSVSETACTHCGTSSKATPMMRRGPAGPRTLCNACGLIWANKGILRDLSKRLPAIGEGDDDSDSDYGIPIGSYSSSNGTGR